MRQFFLGSLLAATAFAAFPVHAEVLGKDGLPAPVVDQLYKKHPNAADISALPKNHFKQELYQIHFKDGEESLIEYYRKNGHFFVSAPVIDPSGLLPPGTLENLKAEFPNHEIKEAIQVANPNGAGEEFDFTLDVSGTRWSVSVDGAGKITEKERF
ncbi:hypothetical protein [Candidatus Methylomicrobium oryzae]|jgi:hypothetical protein|uniref:hypothetical protein n=1 Tax=Candidatus Methylomicrobium oryzae TaxID=2802053 RepID=UPI001921E904|nr:hypothetical protein [Methylomicrobium sp. RS1]MBL1265976.1 hypothetical protein [Methylomicrobium sp. RS1]